MFTRLPLAGLFLHFPGKELGRRLELNLNRVRASSLGAGPTAAARGEALQGNPEALSPWQCDPRDGIWAA